MNRSNHHFLIALTVFLLSAFVLPPQAQAVDYYWYLGSNNGPTGFITPAQACQSFTGWEGQYTVTFVGVEPNIGSSYKCIYDRQNMGANGTNLVKNWVGQIAYRAGTSCPPGQLPQTDYTCACPVGMSVDPLTNQCIRNDDQCKAKVGQSHTFLSSSVPLSLCIGGCELGMDTVAPFKRTASAEVTYHAVYAYTGTTCETPDPEAEPCDDCTPPPPTESSSETECTETYTDASGGQHSDCRTTETMKDNQACAMNGGSIGTVNGVFTCVQANKGPKVTETVTDKKQTTEPKPDGGTKTTTETTTTTTNCVGTKACTSTSTTNTNVTNVNGDGTKGNESSSCKGDNCGVGGKSDEGKEDGEEEQEEEGIDGPSGVLAKGAQGDFAEGISEWDQKITQARSDLTQKIDQLTAQFSGVFDLNLGSGGGSLPCKTVAVSFGKFGSTNLDLCLAAYDQYLGYLRYVLLLAAAVMAAFIVMRD